MGEQVKSAQNGSMVTLSGSMVARVRVDSLFGDNEINEGSQATAPAGSLAGLQASQLTFFCWRQVMKHDPEWHSGA